MYSCEEPSKMARSREIVTKTGRTRVSVVKQQPVGRPGSARTKNGHVQCHITVSYGPMSSLIPHVPLTYATMPLGPAFKSANETKKRDSNIQQPQNYASDIIRLTSASYLDSAIGTPPLHVHKTFFPAIIIESKVGTFQL